LDIQQDNEFATGYGYPKTAFKWEPDTAFKREPELLQMSWSTKQDMRSKLVI